MVKKLSLRIWILIIFLFISLISIVNFQGLSNHGVLITEVSQNSSEFDSGLRTGQILNSINGNAIKDIDDYANFVQTNFPTVDKEKVTVGTNEGEFVFLGKNLEVSVAQISKTNIKTGLDLAGGARALVQAQDKKLTSDEVDDLVAITTNRLNVFGLSDVKVSPVSDLSGNHFMLVEIAGASPKDLKELLEDQGEFKAKIGNETVFVGGDKDISSVCRNDATCAGIESCNPQGDGSYYCNFRFSIYLSESAAKRQADITNNLGLNSSNPGYLEKPLDLYLDGSLVDSLLISEGLKGQVTTQIAISGSGQGATESDAYDVAEENMHKLQTVLITGSLPYKLEIVKLDTISPALGDNFVKSIFLAALAALVAASIVVFIRYRNVKSSLTLILVSFSEIVIILGIAAFIGWNLDLPSIAGILATIGTGFDDQIVILDESRSKSNLSLKQRLKRAFAIIMGAYFTALVSLLPLVWAGAGLLKGFAITTIIGISVGVFITRPAFSDIVKRIEG